MADPSRCRLALPHLCFVAVLLAVVAQTASGQERDTLHLPGLDRPVTLLHDQWGITHIYADTEHDLFFAQGYNAARDRLFQLELWRRKATGTLAEWLGPRAVQADIGARLLRFRGDLETELRHYHPRGPAIVRAFVAGINAYIDHLAERPEALPLEFELLGLAPGHWTPEVVISRHNGLFRNAGVELMLAEVVRALGADRAREMLTLTPASARLTLDSLVAASNLSLDVLDLYAASRGRVRFETDDLAPDDDPFGPSNEETGNGRSLRARPADWFDPLLLPPTERGSNVWAIQGRHTFSGNPLLANDPHRSLELPSLRYWVHLNAPGWNVIGGGEPALPGVAIGHNEHGAWGLTIFAVDQEDLYVYETHPLDPYRYRYGDGWESMRVEHDTIQVRDAPPEPVRLKFTRHGPVLHEDPPARRAYALRAAWLESGGAPYLASLRMDQARTWGEFRRACTYFHTPSENMVWAGRDGTIGWQATGIAPVRNGWDGLLPVPGDGRFEWEGYVPISTLPHVSNPPSGWIASANEYNVPPGYPIALGYFWADRFRISRIEEVLRSGRTFTVRDMMRLQHDVASLPARSLVPLLRGYRPQDRLSQRALDALNAWDYNLDAESVGAAVYVLYEQRLRANVLERLVPETVQGPFERYFLTRTKLIEWLTFPDGRFGEDPLAGRDELVAQSFEEAVGRLRSLLGPVVSRWQYGQATIKHARIEHPLSDAVTPTVRRRLNVGPAPRGGDGSTVNNTSDGLNQRSGGTFRLIVDTGNWDQAVGTNAPGQSGDPDSPHYTDLFELWVEGKYFPVFFSRPKIESVTRRTRILLPE